jgi:CcmD family protein
VSGQAQAMDFLRSTGKIYTVVVVIAIIFIGLAIYLIRLDNKLTKLENHIKNEQ